MFAERRVPRIIPVIDVMGGRVVRAVGGRRDDYRPLLCPFTSSGKPVDVVNALLQMAKANELYIADLDAISGSTCVSPTVLLTLETWPIVTWLDAGIGRNDIRDMPTFPHIRPVVGFETCGSQSVMLEAIRIAGKVPCAFSIDLKNGRLLGNWKAWGLKCDHDAIALARIAIEMGTRTLILLDLARVGTGTGTGTEDLLRAIRAEFPEVDLIAGGGVKTWGDVDALGKAGADAVLVASALHDGTLKVPRS